MSDIKPVRVLFVCMGNICRSPTAQGVFQQLVDEQNLRHAIEVDSAGTHSYHVDSPPDLRAQSTARDHGIDLTGLRARRFVSADFIEFDYLLGMDHANLADMHAIRPEQHGAKLQLMLEYSTRYDQAEVPDPYFGEEGFEQVFDMIKDAADGLLKEIRSRQEL